MLDWPGGTLQIHVYVGFWYGDWFELVIVDADGNILQDLGNIPEVETGQQHSYATNPKHTGKEMYIVRGCSLSICLREHTDSGCTTISSQFLLMKE
ncbi:MAG: hypothetical protein QXF52_00600 [Thermoproteota archaeon]